MELAWVLSMVMVRVEMPPLASYIGYAEVMTKLTLPGISVKINVEGLVAAAERLSIVRTFEGTNFNGHRRDASYPP